MASEIFIDASAWVALIDRSDQSHTLVSNFYPRLATGWPIWITTNLVIAETYRLIRYRNSYQDAARFLRLTRTGSKLIKIYSNQEIDDQAKEILHKYRDQDFSYVDAVSFAVMQQRKITDVLALDHHFSVMGFNRVIQPRA